MIVFAAMLMVQVGMIIDVIRTRRNTFWIIALVMLPVASAVAYLIIEVLPRFRHHHRVREAKAEVARRLDPERELRVARAALDLADTLANRSRLADALSSLGRHAEALPYYRAAAGKTPDFRSGERLARCLYLNDQAVEALALIDGLAVPFGQTDRDQLAMLRARVLEDLDRFDEALPIYADVSERLPGDEARCRHAGLLLKMGRDRDARMVLLEVERRMAQLDRRQISAEGSMYDWAMGELARLRA